MIRRHLLAALGALTLAVPALAQQAAEPEAPVTQAAKILETLAPKDIVLDSSGRPTRPHADPRINLTVQFGFDSAELLPQGQRQLDQLALALGDRRLQQARFELAGHTDRVGDAAYNLRLSLERAESVRNYLMQAQGLSGERLQAIGYGFDRLLVPARPTDAANRRVEVRRLLGVQAAPPQPALPQPRLVPTPK